MIIGCGGGLFEELWVFNEEFVVWVVYDFDVFVILVVGYEIDFVLSDFFVDVWVVMLIVVVEFVVLDYCDLEEWLVECKYCLFVVIR